MLLCLASQLVRAVLIWGLLGLQNMRNNALLLHIIHMSRKRICLRFFNVLTQI